MPIILVTKACSYSPRFEAETLGFVFCFGLLEMAQRCVCLFVCFVSFVCFSVDLGKRMCYSPFVFFFLSPKVSHDHETTVC